MIRAIGVAVVLALSAVPSARALTLESPVLAAVDSTLPSDGGNVRQLAFDGDTETFYASDKPAGKDDHFTLVFDGPVNATEISILGGRADKTDSLGKVAIEVSVDGMTFEQIATGSDQEIKLVFADGRIIKAVRLTPVEDLRHPLIIREISVKSDPSVVTFRWPVEIVVDVADAPELKGWAELTAKACEVAYPMICDELKSDGYIPARRISMTLKSSYRGVAQAAGTRITGSVRFFKDHPDDVGAMVHETTHVVQRYRDRRNPTWLVEGLADYVRFFKYEPGKIGPINAERARYDASYRVTAAFLAYVVEKYDKMLIVDLNRAMREGKYSEEMFLEKTGKTLKELGEEWKASLKK